MNPSIENYYSAPIMFQSAMSNEEPPLAKNNMGVGLFSGGRHIVGDPERVRLGEEHHKRRCREIACDPPAKQERSFFSLVVPLSARQARFADLKGY
jgi:hypothetical protein